MYQSIVSLSLIAAPLAAGLSFPKRDLPVNPSPANGWEYNGCYFDNVHYRQLGMQVDNDFIYDMGRNIISSDQCIAFCGGQGYALAGLEYSGECYCGNALRDMQSGESSGCNMPCAGNADEVCGGPDRLTVYTAHKTAVVDGWDSQGCYTDNVSARALSDLKQIPGGTDAMTPEACLNQCSLGGFTYGGVEYAGECFCGNDILNGAVPFAGGCNMPCKGDGNLLCGGSNRLNLYKVTEEAPTPQ